MQATLGTCDRSIYPKNEATKQRPGKAPFESKLCDAGTWIMEKFGVSGRRTMVSALSYFPMSVSLRNHSGFVSQNLGKIDEKKRHENVFAE